MTDRRAVAITGTGAFAPPGVLSNQDLEKLVDTTDDWIVQRTGIKERRQAAPEVMTSDLCYEAAMQAIEDAGITPKDLDLIIVGTISGDMPMPSTACYLQSKLGAANAGAFDISAACSGFVYGLIMASQSVATGVMNCALVVGAEILTKFLNFEDRGSCILFGDGAGAVIVQPTAEGQASDILHVEMGSDGDQAEVLWIPAGGTRFPATQETVASKQHTIGLDGRAIYKFAVKKFVHLIENAARKLEIEVNEIDFIVPHQVNRRIIESAIEKLGYPLEKVVLNIDRYGNTSAASVPMALDESVREGRIKRGDLVVMPAFGAGLTWGCVALRW